MTMFTRYGIPELLVSDSASLFISDEFKCFSTCNSIRHIKNIPYHVATNELAEQMVQSLKSAKHECGTIHTKFSKFLISYRNSPYTTTREDPINTHVWLETTNKVGNATTQCQNHCVSRQIYSQSLANPPSLKEGDTIFACDYHGHQH